MADTSSNRGMNNTDKQVKRRGADKRRNTSSGNFANNPQRASEMGKKGGRSHGRGR